MFKSVFTMKMVHFQARPVSGLPGPAQLPEELPGKPELAINQCLGSRTGVMNVSFRTQE